MQVVPKQCRMDPNIALTGREQWVVSSDLLCRATVGGIRYRIPWQPHHRKRLLPSLPTGRCQARQHHLFFLGVAVVKNYVW